MNSANRKVLSEASLTNAEIIAKAKAHKWDVFVFSISGTVRRVGLVFDREGYEDVDFRVIDTRTSSDACGREVADRWRRLKRPEEENLIFLRAVELGEPHGQHVLIRMAASSETEMFRCCKCNRLVPGRVDFQSGGNVPYRVISPSLAENPKSKSMSGFNRTAYQEWCNFWRACKEGQ